MGSVPINVVVRQPSIRTICPLVHHDMTGRCNEVRTLPFPIVGSLFVGCGIYRILRRNRCGLIVECSICVGGRINRNPCDNVIVASASQRLIFQRCAVTGLYSLPAQSGELHSNEIVCNLRSSIRRCHGSLARRICNCESIRLICGNLRLDLPFQIPVLISVFRSSTP